LLAVVVLAGCSHEAKQKPYIARVDESVLTEDDLTASYDSLGADRHPTRELVENWITTELLYQEAVRRGLVNTDAIRRQLDAIKKQLVISALLEQELYANDTLAVGDEAVAAWYDSSKQAFLLKEDVVNASFALFQERDAANAFRSKLLHPTPWSDVVASIQKDSLLRPQLLQVATHQYFTQTNLYPEELWKLARTLAKEEVSFVLKTDAGYYVLVVHKFQRQGEVPDLEYIRNEIHDRILVAQRRTAYDRLLTNLRAKHSVEIRIASNDTTRLAE
jgi:hypothetical protein